MRKKVRISVKKHSLDSSDKSHGGVLDANFIINQN